MQVKEKEQLVIKLYQDGKPIRRLLDKRTYLLDQLEKS
jgi:hypothetical protein